MQIRGKKVLITGASSGIGAAAAREMSQRGAAVILVARRADRLKALAEEISQGGGVAHYYVADLTKADEIHALVERVQSELGVPDVLVNNAGAGKWRAIHETSPEDLLFMTQMPYFATFMLTQAFLPYFVERNSGHIVNMTSAAAMLYIPGSAAYSISRWSVRNFTGLLQSELRGTGANASLVMLGKVGDTEYFQANEGSEERIPSLDRYYPVLTSHDASLAIIQAVEKEQAMVIKPWLLWLTFKLQAFMPRLVQSLVNRTSWKWEG